MCALLIYIYVYILYCIIWLWLWRGFILCNYFTFQSGCRTLRDDKLYWSQKLTRLYPLRLLNLHTLGIVSEIAEPCKQNHNPKSAMSDDVCARMCKRFWGVVVYYNMWLYVRECFFINKIYTLPKVLGDITLFIRGARLPLARKQFVFAQKDYGNKPPFVGFCWCEDGGTQNAFSHVKTTMFFFFFLASALAFATPRLLFNYFVKTCETRRYFSITITRHRRQQY